MTLEAPAASAMATSRGCRTPPSAHTCLPNFLCLGGAFEHGGELRPADAGHHPRGAHGARPDADLDDVRARLDQIAYAVRGHDVPRDDGHRRVESAYRAQRVDHPLLVAVRRVHDEGVHARFEQRAGLARHVAVDADGGGDAEPAVGVGGRGVERGAQRALAGEDAGETAVGVDGGRELAVGGVELVERLAGVDVRLRARAGPGT